VRSLSSNESRYLDSYNLRRLTTAAMVKRTSRRDVPTLRWCVFQLKPLTPPLSPFGGEREEFLRRRWWCIELTVI
jgi:hypothetical protein